MIWIGLPGYHVLEPGGLKILILAEDTSAGEAATTFGCLLAQAAGGPLMLMATTDSAGRETTTRERLDRLRQHWQPQLPQLQTQVRRGGSEEIAFEAQAGDYEVVIVGQPEAGASGLDAGASQLLLQAGIPILLVREPRPAIERILICTAAGEPGKSDVRFGGRVAHRVGAVVTVLNIRHRHSGPEEKGRVERHLAQALASLEALGVAGQTKIVEGPVLDRVLQEAEHGDYDLIVIGAPSPPAPQQLFWPDLASQIVGDTTRPVLVVPMLE
jgi:nucleotide-binding universal stress UspA family protein